jgi:hypothetical protein
MMFSYRSFRPVGASQNGVHGSNRVRLGPVSIRHQPICSEPEFGRWGRDNAVGQHRRLPITELSHLRR